DIARDTPAEAGLGASRSPVSLAPVRFGPRPRVTHARDVDAFARPFPVDPVPPTGIDPHPDHKPVPFTGRIAKKVVRTFFGQLFGLKNVDPFPELRKPARNRFGRHPVRTGLDFAPGRPFQRLAYINIPAKGVVTGPEIHHTRPAPHTMLHPRHLLPSQELRRLFLDRARTVQELFYRRAVSLNRRKGD